MSQTALLEKEDGVGHLRLEARISQHSEANPKQPRI